MTDVVGELDGKTHEVLGRHLTRGESEAFIKYLNLLIKWQRTQRLIGSAEPSWIIDNVIVDSLLFLRAIPQSVARLCDVGSGAGIPGIPLAIVSPAIHVTLIEARQKRASFLSAAIREIPLRNCRVLNQRLEDVGRDNSDRFDAAVLRCAGSPITLVRQLLPLLPAGGVVIASGPPRRTAVPLGSWLELEGPSGPRRFWVHHVT
jgi:16S rRNA (guanine527-N7)-methyltransferase